MDDRSNPGAASGTALPAFEALRGYLNSQILGQENLVERLLVALLADGHLLVEGPPGLAKTRAIKALASGLECDFQRVQFTPDMLPADLTGSDIYRPEAGGFQFQRGPLFHNLILADEVNRAPAKVQSALLEAMGERQISVGSATYQLPRLFLVMATQNPLEHEGTYPLPEAQLDRFMLHTLVDYPDRATTLRIMELARREAQTAEELPPPAKPLPQATVFAARGEALGLTLSDAVAEYIAALVEATRRPAPYSAKLAEWLRWGASPRAAISIERGARAFAWLHGRDYVSPEDVQAIAPDALRHRLLLDYTAQARGISAQACVEELLSQVPAP
ncbi:AAA family ATPase [Nevskia soli]|uniref:AAA family ATPase n=1 Tax=Nevskia soli TaxID=418856 RepID=UPI0004A6EA21|nr:MoxR family ATPase [Nevskia soli]